MPNQNKSKQACQANCVPWDSNRWFTAARFNKRTRRNPSVPRPGKVVARSRLEKTMESLGLDMSNKDDVCFFFKFIFALKKFYN